MSMVRVGCKEAMVAPITSDKSALETQSGVPEITYGKIIPLPNLQQIDLNMSVQSVDVDSDDGTETISACTGCSGTMTRNSFSPEESEILLGETKINGITVSKGIDEPPLFALGYRSLLKGDDAKGHYLCMWVLRAKFSLGSMTAESMGNEKLNPQADAISFKSSVRKCDGAWRMYIRTKDTAEIKKFFSLETLQMLTDATTQTYTSPVSAVKFVDTEPTENGEVGVIYIYDDKAHYWDGSDYVEVDTKADTEVIE